MNKIMFPRFNAGLCWVSCVSVTLLGGKFSARGGDVPVITGFVRSNLYSSQVFYTNCSDASFDYSVQSSSNLVDWVDAPTVRGATTNTTVTASIVEPGNQSFHRVVKRPHISVPTFSMAIMVSSNIIFNGNNILIDSYDSSDTNRSTGGQYDVTKRSDHGDVGTDLTVTNSLTVGNADIYGNAHTGTGSSSNAVAVASSGSVGNLAWVNGGNAGIQAGAWLSDMNVSFPDVAPPSSSGIAPVSSVTYSNVIYDYALNSTGTLYVLTAPLSGRVLVTAPNTILWAKGGVNFSGNGDEIRLTPGASMTLYMGNTSGTAVSASFGGVLYANTNGYARNLQVYGLPTCTSISVRGGSQFCGTIYAPQADFTGSGGASRATRFFGRLIARSVVVNGHCEYHYDESLSVTGP